MQSCSVCHGQKYIKSPDGKLWQQCPVCLGSGVDESGALPFAYHIDPLLAANAAGVLSTIQIQNRDFKLQMITGSQQGNFSIELIDLVTGTPLMDNPVSNANIVGTAQNPGLILTPYVFAKNTRLGVKLTDNSGAQNQLHLTFHGANLPG